MFKKNLVILPLDDLDCFVHFPTNVKITMLVINQTQENYFPRLKLVTVLIFLYVVTLPLVLEDNYRALPLVLGDTYSALPLVLGDTYSALPLVLEDTYSALPLVLENNYTALPFVLENTYNALPLVL